MAGTGWLRAPGHGSTGFGLDYSLSQSLNALQSQTQDTFNDRVFNMTGQQGDMLIWVGQKPFFDMRLPLYVGEGDDDLLALHRKTRESLRIQYLPISAQEAETMEVKPQDWKPVFAEYQISYAIPQLTMSPVPDYAMLRAFIFSGRDWQLTSLSGTAAVFHRVDPNNAELMQFNKEHRYDFVAQAFREDTKAIGPRTAWAAPPGIYEENVWKTKPQIPEPIQQAHHLNVILQDLVTISAQMPLADRAVYPALAWLALREAQKGLDEDPTSAEGYVELGNAYRYLAFWNQGSLMGMKQWQGQGMRFFQSMMAYNQALAADPDNLTAHSRLFEYYSSPGFLRVDLALRELEALETMMSRKPNATEAEQQQLKQLGEMREKMSVHVEQLSAELDKAAKDNADPLQLAQIASQRYNCPLAALEQLEKSPEFVATNPNAKLFYLTMLLESGRIEDAYQTAMEIEYEQNATQNQLPNWRSLVVAAYLANAEYEKAQELWKAEGQQIEMNGFRSALSTLPPRVIPNSPQPWPIPTINSAYQYFSSRDSRLTSLNLDIAYALLESGQCEAAGKQFQRTLEDSPDSSARHLIGFYLAQINQEMIDPVPPSDRVPVLFADGNETDPSSSDESK